MVFNRVLKPWLKENISIYRDKLLPFPVRLVTVQHFKRNPISTFPAGLLPAGDFFHGFLNIPSTSTPQKFHFSKWKLSFNFSEIFQDYSFWKIFLHLRGICPVSTFSTPLLLLLISFLLFILFFIAAKLRLIRVVLKLRYGFKPFSLAFGKPASLSGTPFEP